MKKRTASLGPADETSDPNVVIEIRAAEIAVLEQRGLRTWQEADGWAHHLGRMLGGTRPIASPTRKGHLAGWLARQIVWGD